MIVFMVEIVAETPPARHPIVALNLPATLRQLGERPGRARAAHRGGAVLSAGGPGGVPVRTRAVKPAGGTERPASTLRTRARDRGRARRHLNAPGDSHVTPAEDAATGAGGAGTGDVDPRP
ncbi:MAG: hypothetical protein ACREM3_30835, partial [Candidatus Rokuibacteriota bacterium]